MPKSDDDEATRKRLVAFSERDERILLLDNVTSFGGPIWDAALTSDRITDRPVGARDMVDLPWRAVVAVTGNGVKLLGDVGRRVLPVRLKTDAVDPESRTGFRYPLPRWAIDNHPQLYLHALAVARHAVVDQVTKADGTPWGSFEAWCEVVRRAVVLATGVDPLATRELVKGADDTAVALRQFLVAIQNLGKRTAAELINEAEATTDERIKRNPELHETLCVLAGGAGGKLHPRGVGTQLQRHADRVVRYDDGSECKLQRDATSSRGTLWYVVRVREPDPVKPKVSETGSAEPVPVEADPAAH
jgi:hypothetical protein